MINANYSFYRKTSHQKSTWTILNLSNRYIVYFKNNMEKYAYQHWFDSKSSYYIRSIDGEYWWLNQVCTANVSLIHTLLFLFHRIIVCLVEDWLVKVSYCNCKQSIKMNIVTSVSKRSLSLSVSMQFHFRKILNWVMIFSYINTVANSIFYMTTITLCYVFLLCAYCHPYRYCSVQVKMCWIIQVEPEEWWKLLWEWHKTKNQCIECVWVCV